MRPFTSLTSLVVALDRADVDTDALLPKQFMKSVTRSGFGRHLFDGWRYLDPGYPGKPPAQRQPDPVFVLNQPRYQGAQILLARDNFGCGSSREHALWALAEHGIRAIIAPSFASIFFDNCFKNGLLPVRLAVDEVQALFNEVEGQPGYCLHIDLQAQRLECPDGTVLSFAVDAVRKAHLIQGLDEIDQTMQRIDEIRRYERQRRGLEPWLFDGIGQPDAPHHGSRLVSAGRVA